MITRVTLAFALAGALGVPAARADEALDDVRAEVEMAHRRIDRLEPFALRLSGWVDVGFFAVGGDGSGVRADVGHVYFPAYDGRVPGAWVLMGDPLSTAINARGEPADTGASRAFPMDSVDAGGHPSALVNTFSLAIRAEVSERLLVSALLDVVPRSRDPEAPAARGLGDFIDLKLAQVRWAPDVPLSLELYAGKVNSVLGVEYRQQEAPDRLAVTPSLVCRYTCGHPIGAGAFARLLQERLTVNVAVTNGSHAVETFPVSAELDTNDAKTGAGRAAVRLAGEDGRLEVGVSGELGAEDAQASDRVLQWHAGLDVSAEWRDLVFAGEVVKGNAEGRTGAGAAARCDLAECLDYKAAYGLLAHRTLRWLWPYLRVDWRDATLEHGAAFVYLSRLMRGTLGVHCELGLHVIAKAEYTWNRELGGIPQFPDDVFTTSLVVRY